MAWQVVLFTNSNPEEVEAVPERWLLSSTECYWPPYSGAKLKASIANSETPKDDWDIHDIRVLGKKCDNLRTARLKAIKAESNSDINTDNENSAKRSRKQNSRWSPSHLDEESEDDFLEEDSIPMPSLSKTQEHPIRTFVNLSTSAATHITHVKEVNMRSTPSASPRMTSLINRTGAAPSNLSERLYLSPSAAVTTPMSDVNELNMEITTPSNLSERLYVNQSASTTTPMAGVNDVNIASTPSISATITSSINRTGAATTSLSDDAFKRIVIRQLSIINTKLDHLSEDIMNLKQNSDSVDPQPEADSLLNKYNFPLKTNEELNEVEELIANKETSLQFVKDLGRIGGSNYKIMVKRILSRLFSNQLAMEYSWIGFKSKKNFSVLAICGLIIDAIKKHSTATVADIESAMKLWLVKAKERENNKSKKN